MQRRIEWDLAIAISSILLEFSEAAMAKPSLVTPLRLLSTEYCIVVAVTSLSLSILLSISIMSPAASEARRLDVLPNVCKFSSRNVTSAHHGMFLNGVFLGVQVTEEIVPAMPAVEELTGRMDDEGDGACAECS